MSYTGPTLAVNEYAYLSTLLLSIYMYAPVAQHQYMMNELDRLDINFNEIYYSNGTANPWFSPFPGANIDTLYAWAFLDLTNTIIELRTPDTSNLELWYSITLTDAYTELTAVLPGKNKSQKPKSYLLVGPNFKTNNIIISDDYKIIKCPTNIMALMSRIAIKDDDLITSFNVMYQITIDPLTQNADVLDVQTFPDTVYRTMEYFQIAAEIVDYSPPPKSEKVLYELFAEANVNFKLPFIPPVPGSAIEDGYLRAVNFTQDKFLPFGYQWGTGQINVNQWQAATILGKYGTDYARRAYAFYVKAILPNTVEEQFYPSAFRDVNGNILNTALYNYTLHIPAELMPKVDSKYGFMSLTLYDGITFNMIPNELDRYGFNTNYGNFYDEDGSASFFFSRDPPEDPFKYSKWLPSPDGPFYVTLRMYQADISTIYNFYLPGIEIDV